MVRTEDLPAILLDIRSAGQRIKESLDFLAEAHASGRMVTLGEDLRAWCAREVSDMDRLEARLDALRCSRSAGALPASTIPERSDVLGRRLLQAHLICREAADLGSAIRAAASEARKSYRDGKDGDPSPEGQEQAARRLRDALAHPAACADRLLCLLSRLPSPDARSSDMARAEAALADGSALFSASVADLLGRIDAMEAGVTDGAPRMPEQGVEAGEAPDLHPGTAEAFSQRFVGFLLAGGLPPHRVGAALLFEPAGARGMNVHDLMAYPHGQEFLAGFAGNLLAEMSRMPHPEAQVSPDPS